MVDFFNTYWSQILLSLITAGALAFCRYAYKKIQKYKALAERQDEKELCDLIENQLQPINEKIQVLQQEIKKVESNDKFYLETILSSYRFRLIQLCKSHLDRGRITTEQFEQLSEFFKIYSKLGGNGQAKEYYERAKELPICDE